MSTDPCHGRRYGEVVAVIGSPKIAVGTVSASGVNDPNVFACIKAVGRYLGAPAQYALGGGWTPSSVTAALAAGPTPRQRSDASSEQLTVKINIYDQDGKLVPDSKHTVSNYSAMCIAVPTAGRQLTGPLMDVGDKPLPFR